MEGASFRSFFDLIGGRYAVTPLSWLLIAIPSILPNIVYDRAINGGSVGDWALAGFAGTVTGGVVYLTLGSALLPRRPRPSRPVTAILVFGVTGVTRGVTIAWASVAMGLTTDPQWLFRIVGGAALGIAWFSLAAIVIDAWIGHRDAVRDLDQRRRETLALRHEAAAELASTRTEIRETVLAQVTAILSSLGSAMRQGTDVTEVRQVATRLHVAVADVVRPLSHSLASRGTTIVIERGREPLGQRFQSWFRGILRDALTMDPYHPVFIALVIVPSTLAAAVRDFGPIVGILGSMSIGVITWAGFRLARHLSRTRTRPVGRWSWLPAIAVYFLVGFLASLVPAIAAVVLGQSASVAWRSSGQSLLILVPIASLGAAVFAAEERRRSMIELDLEAEVAHAEWVTHRVQQELWAANHRLARELHGNVQSQLTAAALRLEVWAHQPDPATLPLLLEQVTAVLEQVVTLLEEQSHAPVGDAPGAVSAVTAVWRGVATVSLGFDDEASDSVSADPAACESVVEIVRECIGNAVRHGRAASLRVSVRQHTPSAVEVLIDDDGRGVPLTAVPGLGSQLLDQACLSWERTPRHPGTRVAALVAVNPAAPVADGTWETQSA